MPKVLFRRLDDQAVIPSYAMPGDSGMDLCCLWAFSLDPGERALVSTGIGVAIEDGYEGQIRPRSGHALKKGVTVLNSPGTIDAGYRGELCVLLHNASGFAARFDAGAKIAQLVIAAVPVVEIVVVDELPPSERGTNGFGSTGA